MGETGRNGGLLKCNTKTPIISLFKNNVTDV